jgi:hypothetical protein
MLGTDKFMMIMGAKMLGAGSKMSANNKSNNSGFSQQELGEIDKAVQYYYSNQGQGNIPTKYGPSK